MLGRPLSDISLGLIQICPAIVGTFISRDEDDEGDRWFIPIAQSIFDESGLGDKLYCNCLSLEIL